MAAKRWVVGGIQWPQFQHGVETWVLWRHRGGRTKVEKIDGRWTLTQLGYQQPSGLTPEGTSADEKVT